METTFPKVSSSLRINYYFSLSLYPPRSFEISRFFSRRFWIKKKFFLWDAHGTPRDKNNKLCVVHWNWWMQSLVKENANWPASIRLQSATASSSHFLCVCCCFSSLFLRFKKKIVVCCLICCVRFYGGWRKNAVPSRYFFLGGVSPLFWWKYGRASIVHNIGFAFVFFLPIFIAREASSFLSFSSGG